MVTSVDTNPDVNALEAVRTTFSLYSKQTFDIARRFEQMLNGDCEQHPANVLTRSSETSFGNSCELQRLQLTFV